MNGILKYPGAKNRIAPWICEHIPEHKVYLEPFFGSGAVFFHKNPCHIETINDLYGEIVNFFKMLRDYPDDLLRAIELTPFSREEYNNACFEIEGDEPLEKARKFCVWCWQSFGSNQKHKSGFRSGQQSNSPNPARAWGGILLNSIESFAIRIKDAQIECLPAIELINRYCTPDVFIYCDPPYLTELRKNHLYRFELSRDDQITLLESLIKHPGMVMISGYDSDLYNTYLRGWNKVKKKTMAELSLSRTEVLWMNYELGQIKMVL